MKDETTHIQIETFKDGLLYPDLINFSGDYVIIINKEVIDNKIVSTHLPMKISDIKRITYTTKAEKREIPQRELLTEEENKQS